MGAEVRRDVTESIGVADWPGDPTAAEIEATQAWRRLGLTDEEFARFREALGRPPSWTELGMLSVAWSEHCAYKHSREALKRLPATGPRLLMGPGESAGVLAIAEGWAVAVRLESHNHPSYVEPYQGAATGVGGIVRDVLAAGARPVALLDSLRFGLPETPANRYLFREVVAGIAGYGNAIGVPTVGGEVAFAPCYDTNPLVNVMCVGWVRQDRVARARADGPGNLVYLVGARTGRDGIHGAGLLASRTFRDGEGGEQRPRVQVGDPFTEKLLIEACLEALETGAVVGIQDLGAAGITAAASELAARAGTGIDLDLDRVPCREAGMTPYELMLSESQERMMLVVRAGREAEVERVFARWRLEAAPIGVVTATGRLRVRAGGRWVADVPAALLADGAPRHPVPPPRRPGKTSSAAGPVGRAALEASPAISRPAPAAGDSLRARVTARLVAHLSSPHGGSRAWIYRQFDHMVGVRTVLPPGHDAAVLRVLPDEAVPGAPAPKADGGERTGRMPFVALSVNGAEWLAATEGGAWAAGAEAVLEGARKVAAVGAVPIGITNGLNLGNPERAEVRQALADVVAGMGDACSALGIPVTGGNVSLYNETVADEATQPGGASGPQARAIWPTAIVGMVGLLEGERPVPSAFQRADEAVLLLGWPALWSGEGAWPVDFDRERVAIAFVAEAARRGLLSSCHAVGRWGIAAALCEAALGARGEAAGVDVTLPAMGPSVEALLFGAGGPAWVAAAAPEAVPALEQLAGRAEVPVPVHVIGRVTPGRIRMTVAGQGVVFDEPLDALRAAWERALEEAARP
ncbi:MAG TPA: phosphoribosylformylglycinamidine synthase subunit PurL [Limnochordales bacterium]